MHQRYSINVPLNSVLSFTGAAGPDYWRHSGNMGRDAVAAAAACSPPPRTNRA
jgi:hypothetical protein